MATLALLGLAGAIAYQQLLRAAYRQEQAQRELAEQARQEAVESRDRLEGEKQKTEVALDAERKAKAGEAAAKEQLEQVLYLRRVAGAYVQWKDNEVARAKHLLAECPLARGHWEWHYVTRLCEGGKLTFEGHTAPVDSVCFSPDGQRLASASAGGTIKIWDAAPLFEPPAAPK